MPDMLVKLYELPESREVYSALAEKGIKIIRPMTPNKTKVVEWVREHFHDGWADEISAAFTRHPVGCFIAYDEQNNTLRTDGTVGTLTTDGSSPKHNNRVIVGGNSVRIRRLTPRECWRLQGFPDSYFDKAKAAGISDTQLYKMAGNAVTVNVARAIGEKLKEIEDEET